jgi:hypothetical protein
VLYGGASNTAGTRRAGIPPVLPLSLRPRTTPGPEPRAPPTTMPGTALVNQRHHHHHQTQSRSIVPGLDTAPASSSITPVVSAVPSAPEALGQNRSASPVSLQLQIPLQNSNSTYRYSGPASQLPPIGNSPGPSRGNSRPIGPRGPRRPGTPVGGGSPSGLQSVPAVWPPYDIDDDVPMIQRSNPPNFTSASLISPLNTSAVHPSGRSSGSPTSATTPRGMLSDVVINRPLSFHGSTVASRTTAGVRPSEPIGQETNSSEVGDILQRISPTPTLPFQSPVRSSPMRREIGGSASLPSDEDTVMG